MSPSSLKTELRSEGATTRITSPSFSPPLTLAADMFTGPSPELAMWSVDDFQLSAAYDATERDRWSTALTSLHHGAPKDLVAPVVGLLEPKLVRPVTVQLVVDVVHFAQQRTDLSAGVTGEVRANTGAQVGGLADVEHVPGAIAEGVHAGRPRERGGHPELRRLLVTTHAGQREQVVEDWL